MANNTDSQKELIKKIKAEHKLFLLELSKLRGEQSGLLEDYRKKLEELKIALIKEKIGRTSN